MMTLLRFALTRLFVALVLATSLIVPRPTRAQSAAEALESLAANTRRVQLPNGMRVSLLKTDEDEGVAYVSLTLRFGTEASLAGRAWEATQMGYQLRSGSTTLNGGRFVDAAEAVGSEYRFLGGTQFVRVEFEARSSQVRQALDLALRVLRDPYFDEFDLSVWPQNAVSNAANARQQSSTVSELALLRRLEPYPAGHLLERATIEGDSAASAQLARTRLKDLYSRNVGATNGDLVVVGDFNPDSVTAWARRSLGAWRSPIAPVRVARRYVATAPAEETLSLPSGARGASVRLGQALQLRSSDADFVLLTIANYALGSHAADDNRLATTLTKRRKVANRVGSELIGFAQDSAGVFMVAAHAGPDSLSAAEQALREALTAFVRDGITDAELATAKRQLLDAQNGSFYASSVYASYLGAEGREEMSIADHQRMLQTLSSATRDQVNAAIRKHIDPARMVVVRASPPGR